MPHYVIDVHHHTHTCPTSRQPPHIVHTRRTIVAIEPGGPCTRPVTLHTRTGPVVVACARAVPTPQRCPACPVAVAVRHPRPPHHGPTLRGRA